MYNIIYDYSNTTMIYFLIIIILLIILFLATILVIYPNTHENFTEHLGTYSSNTKDTMRIYNVTETEDPVYAMIEKNTHDPITTDIINKTKTTVPDITFANIMPEDSSFVSSDTNVSGPATTHVDTLDSSIWDTFGLSSNNTPDMIVKKNTKQTNTS